MLFVVALLLLGTYAIIKIFNVFEQTQQDEPQTRQEHSSVTDQPPGTQQQQGHGTGIHSYRLSLTAVGDIMLGRNVEIRLRKAEKDYRYPVDNVKDLLKKGDIIFGNLEAPITESSISLDPKKKIIIKSGTSALDTLRYAGFNMLSLANNHMMDYYEKGMYDTIAYLDGARINHVGAGSNIEEASKLQVIEKNGLKIGFLSFTEMAEYVFAGNPPLRHAADGAKSGVAPLDYKIVASRAAEASPQVDILAVSLHWGIEESFEITDKQIEFAHKLIDSGVDLVLGHHPHQCQGMEVYKGKLVIYSLGNFIFDMNDPENQESYIVNADFDRDRMVSLTAFPIMTLQKIQVVPQTGEAAMNNLTREQKLCNELGTKTQIKDGILEFNLDYEVDSR